MTDQNTRDGVPPPTRTDERDRGVHGAHDRDGNRIQVEAHRIGVEAVARALDQAA
jgi:hypothetical protein